MDIRKTIILACATTTMGISTATAQDIADAQPMPQRQERRMLPPSPEKQATLMTHRMDSLLGLTEKQYKKLYKLNLKQAKQQMEGMNGNRPPRMNGGPRPDGGGPGQRGMGGRPPMGGGQGPRRGPAPQGRDNGNIEKQRETAKKQNEKTEKKIKKILTDDQYTKWQEARESIMKGKDKGRPHGKPGADKRSAESTEDVQPDL